MRGWLAAARGPGRWQQEMQTKIRCKQNANLNPRCRQMGLGAAWGGETAGRGTSGVPPTQLCTRSRGTGPVEGAEGLPKHSQGFPSRKATASGMGDPLSGSLLPHSRDIPARGASSRGCLRFSSCNALPSNLGLCLQHQIGAVNTPRGYLFFLKAK